MTVWQASPTLRGRAAWLCVQMERRFGDRAGRALRLLQGVALGRGRPDAVAVIRTAIAFSEMRGPT